MSWYLVLVLSMFGETMTTNHIPFYGQQACEIAKVQILDGLSKSPGVSPAVKLAQCVKGV